MRSGGWRPFWTSLLASLLVLVPLVGGTVLLSRQQLRAQLRQAARSESGVPVQLPRTTDQLTVRLCVSGEQPGFVLAYLNASQDVYKRQAMVIATVEGPTEMRTRAATMKATRTSGRLAFATALPMTSPLSLINISFRK